MLNSVVKKVNFVKKSGTIFHLFKQFYKEMDSDHGNLVVYCSMQKKENVVAHFYELRTEMKLFWEMVKKDAFVDFFSDKTWLQALAYLADITKQFNNLICDFKSQIQTLYNLETFCMAL